MENPAIKHFDRVILKIRYRAPWRSTLGRLAHGELWMPAVEASLRVLSAVESSRPLKASAMPLSEFGTE